MSPRSRHRSSSVTKKSGSSSRSRMRTDDWTEVTEPEERRRIQNRIAQRKFREKVREQRERSERESRNQEHAGSSYHIPEPKEIVDEEELSGLPWGSLSLGHVISKGHENESRRGSRRESENQPRPEDTQYLAPYPDPSVFVGAGMAAGFEHDGGSSGDDRAYFDDGSVSPYYYGYEAGAGGGALDPSPPHPQILSSFRSTRTARSQNWNYLLKLLCRPELRHLFDNRSQAAAASLLAARKAAALVGQGTTCAGGGDALMLDVPL